MFAVAAADEVNFRALAFDARGVEAGEHAAKREVHARVRGADLARENFGVRITGGAQETQADQIGALLSNLFDDVSLGVSGLAWSNMTHSWPARLTDGGGKKETIIEEIRKQRPGEGIEFLSTTSYPQRRNF